jgi:hypothetical protein
VHHQRHRQQAARRQTGALLDLVAGPVTGAGQVGDRHRVAVVDGEPGQPGARHVAADQRRHRLADRGGHVQVTAIFVDQQQQAQLGAALGDRQAHDTSQAIVVRLGTHHDLRGLYGTQEVAEPIEEVGGQAAVPLGHGRAQRTSIGSAIRWVAPLSGVTNRV